MNFDRDYDMRDEIEHDGKFTSLGPSPYASELLSKHKLGPGTLQIWSDGAINIHNPKKPGGWSSVFVYNKVLMCTQWAGVAPTTSQRMELTGALEGLRAVLEGRHKELDTIVYNTIEVVSDSAYLTNCFLQMWWLEWKYNGWKTSTTGEDVKNRDLWEEIISVVEQLESKGLKVTWKKVKGHCGIMYNEVADKLAVKGKLSVS